VVLLSSKYIYVSISYYSKYRYTRKVQKQKKQILKNQCNFANDAHHRVDEELVPSPSASLSNSTIPYAEYNTSSVHWSDFGDVTSMMKAKGKETMDDEEEEAQGEKGDEDEDEDYNADE
jgi:hypothetical protein